MIRVERCYRKSRLVPRYEPTAWCFVSTIPTVVTSFGISMRTGLKLVVTRIDLRAGDSKQELS